MRLRRKTTPDLRPLLTNNVTAEVLYGYGDPCVVRDGGGWWLVATSNDAPQSFPILRSEDLESWRLEGFMFPRGAKPGWAMDGPGSDFWAPEMHRTADGWLGCFAARTHAGELAIGLARADQPAGPWTADTEPLLGGGVIDPHLVVEPHRTLLFWKEDANDLWPGLLAALLREEPGLVEAVFADPAGRAAARDAAARWPQIAALAPMARFEALSGLIAAATDDFAACRARLARLEGSRAAAICEAMRTRIFARELRDGRLVGPRVLVLQNDRPWEAHLIEGMWVARIAGRWRMFYSGNDFSTARYGVGVADADDPLGPWTKAEAPFLTSTAEWQGPGHPSVAEGPDGRPWLFLHAFRPGALGYKAFRALLALPLEP
jgi:arabinan endo-1,5-alpha-L-arabinosidase